jgi:hypothetical protein
MLLLSVQVAVKFMKQLVTNRGQESLTHVINLWC